MTSVCEEKIIFMVETYKIRRHMSITIIMAFLPCIQCSSPLFVDHNSWKIYDCLPESWKNRNEKVATCLNSATHTMNTKIHGVAYHSSKKYRHFLYVWNFRFCGERLWSGISFFFKFSRPSSISRLFTCVLTWCDILLTRTHFQLSILFRW